MYFNTSLLFSQYQCGWNCVVVFCFFLQAVSYHFQKFDLLFSGFMTKLRGNLDPFELMEIQGARCTVIITPTVKKIVHICSCISVNRDTQLLYIQLH